METRHQRRASIQMKERIDQINYELADERIQHLELKESIQTILEIDVHNIENMENMRTLIVDLQKQLDNEYHDKLQHAAQDESEQVSMAKADEKIKNVDIEQEMDALKEQNDEDIGYETIDDVDTLKK